MADTRLAADPSTEVTVSNLTTGLSGPAVMSLIGLLTATQKQVHLGRLHMRPIQWHLKKQLEGTGITRKGHSYPQVSAPPSEMVAGGKQCSSRSTLHPIRHALQIFTDASKEGGVRPLKETHCKRNLVPSRKETVYKFPGTDSGLFGPERVPRPLLRQDSSFSYRQHHSGVHKHGSRAYFVLFCGES